MSWTFAFSTGSFCGPACSTPLLVERIWRARWSWAWLWQQRLMVSLIENNRIIFFYSPFWWVIVRIDYLLTITQQKDLQKKIISWKSFWGVVPGTTLLPEDPSGLCLNIGYRGTEIRFASSLSQAAWTLWVKLSLRVEILHLWWKDVDSSDCIVLSSDLGLAKLCRGQSVVHPIVPAPL